MKKKLMELLPKCKFRIQGGDVVEVINLSNLELECVATNPVDESLYDNYRFDGTARVEIKVGSDGESIEKPYYISGSFKEDKGEIVIKAPVIIKLNP